MKGFKFLLIGLVIFLPIQSFGFQANEDQDGYLSNPRRAVHTFLHWQQKGHQNMDRVILPFKESSQSKEDKIELATELRKVLDARGLLVVYENVPNNPNYSDSLSGLTQYILFDKLPEVYLVKRNNEWVFAEATIEQIPTLYQATFPG